MRKRSHCLKKSKKMFMTLVESLPDCIKLFDLKGELIYINKGGLEEHRLKSLNQALRMGWEAVESIVPEDREKFAKALKDAAKGKVSVIEIRHTKEGSKREACEEIIAPVRDEKNKVFAVIGGSRDITDRRRAERKVKEKEKELIFKKKSLAEAVELQEKLEMFTESIPDCIKLFNLKGELIYINKGGLEEHRLKNLPQALRMGWEAVESIVPEDRGKFAKALKDAAKGKVSVIEIRHTKKGSRREACEEIITPIKDEKNNIIGIFGGSRDITSRKRMQKKLEKIIKEFNIQNNVLLETMRNLKLEKERTETYLKIAGNIIVALDKKGAVTMINKKGSEMLGYKKSELIGKNWFEVCLPSNEKKNKEARFKKLMAGKLKAKELREESVACKNGENKIILWNDSLLRDDKGKIAGLLISGSDITELKRIDRTKTEFISLASHQLRTPLTAIGWYTEMFLDKKEWKISGKQKEYLEKIHRSNKRMSDLVNALLNVSRLEMGTFKLEPVTIDPRKKLNVLMEELSPQIASKKLSFKKTIEKDVPQKIKIDPNLYTLILENLLSNAVKYTPQNGRIRLKISKKGKNLGITVEDSGYGIPEKQQDKIFTKLFRADNIKQRDTDGTGLGLYLVKAILDYAGGSVKFKSKENAGSVFYVMVPFKNKIINRKYDKKT